MAQLVLSSGVMKLKEAGVMSQTGCKTGLKALRTGILLSLGAVAFLGLAIGQSPNFISVWQLGGGQHKLSIPNTISSIATDQDGNILIGGYLFASNPSFALPHSTNQVPEGGFLAKLCPCGNLVWWKSLGTNSGYYGVTADHKGNVYAVGYTNIAPSDFVLRKYDPQGNVLWTFHSVGQKVDAGNQVAVDASNNVCMTGIFSSTNLQIGPISLTNDFPLGWHFNWFLAKFDASGKPVWAHALYGASEHVPKFSPGFDLAGNVVLGTICEKALNFGAATLTNIQAGDIFAAKFDPSGKVVSLKIVGGNCDPVKMNLFSSVNATGSIVFGGSVSGANPNGPTITFGSITLTNSPGFIAKVDGNANVLWAKPAPYGEKIYTDAAGNAYQIGNTLFSSNVFLSGLKLTSPTSHMAYIAKYDSIGNILWATRLYSMEDDPRLGAISGDRWGNIYLGGTFNGPTVFGGMSVKSLNTNEAFLARVDVSH